jgi:glycine betaine/proline transport system permease protein
MSGATPRQLFWQVRIPAASRQLLLGVNQATMAAFSMVIIASIIGGTADIGWEVLSTMRKAQFGESVLAGIVIALLAMVMDRITAGLAMQESDDLAEDQGFAQRHRYWLIALGAGAACFAVAQFVPFLKVWPEAWRFYPADAMNDALTDFVAAWAPAIAQFKSLSFFYVMLPTRIGLEQTISPYSWGFELTTAHSLGYAVLMAAATLGAWRRWSARAAVVVAFFAILFYFGLTKLPWAALIAMAGLLAWQLGGRRLAIGTAAALIFLLIAGVWPQAMLSVYLCGIAVAISFALGTGIGILASEVGAVSAVVRPINDTLQTMPLFVILIPFVMIFKIGEFTALLAIIAYAIVPAIRYSEHGLRNLPKEVLEAGVSMGCTRWQLLWQVKLPLALPVLMLGLNQTIMYGIAMLVIAALVGTNGLGQQVYIGLGDGDFGVGMIAGIGMAIIAMIADRLTQSWSKARQEAFGL